MSSIPWREIREMEDEEYDGEDRYISRDPTSEEPARPRLSARQRRKERQALKKRAVAVLAGALFVAVLIYEGVKKFRE